MLNDSELLVYEEESAVSKVGMLSQPLMQLLSAIHMSLHNDVNVKLGVIPVEKRTLNQCRE